MGIKKKGSVGCGCCLVSCVTAIGSGSSTSCSGSWSSPSSGLWSPTAANSFRLYDDHADGATWAAQVYFDFDVITSSANTRWRLIGGAADCSNYVFFEVWQYAYYEPGVTRRLRLGYVEAGVETVVCQHPADNGTYQDLGSPLSFSLGISLCYDGRYVYASAPILTGAGGGNDAWLASRDIPVFGGKGGFGVNEFTNINSATFYDFLLHRSEVKTCEDCARHCCMGTVPEAMVVEVSGVDSEIVEPYSPASSAEADCADMLNGTHVLTRFEDRFYNRSEFGGDGNCLWEGVGPTFELTPPTTTDENLGIRMTSSFTYGTTGSDGLAAIIDFFYYIMAVEQTAIRYTYNSTEIWRCVDWVPWQSLTWASTPYLCSGDGSAAYARFKIST